MGTERRDNQHMRRLFVLLMIMSSWICTAQVRVYVATNGNDNWSGTLAAPNENATDGPFATLERARTELRTRKAQSPLTNGATVYVRGGTYYRTNAFSILSQDSGISSNTPITYSAYVGEHPCLIGGMPITNFVPWKGQILKADVAADGYSGIAFHQLISSGQRQILARYPNFDTNDPYGAGWSYVDGTVTNMGIDLPTDSMTQFKYKVGDVRSWANPQEAEVFIFPRYNWWNNIIPVASIDTVNRLITLSNSTDYAIRPGDRYFIQNVAEELDSPGEWYLDKTTWTLYWWPQNMNGQHLAYAPIAQYVVEMGFGASNVVFKGFQLECSVGHGVFLYYTTGCQIIGNTITNVGDFNGSGVSCYNATNSLVYGNDISKTGAGGITIYGGNWTNLTSANNVAENNLIFQPGVFAKSGSGILLEGVGHRASHNLIYSCPRAGIRFDGNNIVVEYNYIHDVNLETDDTGAIYTEGGDWVRSRGSVIQFNHIHGSLGYGFSSGVRGTPKAAYGVYIDNQSVGVDVLGNVIDRCSLAGIMFNGALECHANNNIVLDVGNEEVRFYGYPAGWSALLPTLLSNYSIMTGQEAWASFRGLQVSPEDVVLPNGLIMTSNEFTHNIVSYTNTAAKLYDLTDTDTEHNEWDKNIIYAGGTDIIAGRTLSGTSTTIAWSTWQSIGPDRNSIIADPRFMRATNSYYRLLDGSPTMSTGFFNIPFDRIGPYASPLRASWAEDNMKF
jgi:hypothetical protein